MTYKKTLDELTDANLESAMGVEPGESDLAPFVEPEQDDITEIDDLVTDTDDTVDVSEEEEEQPAEGDTSEVDKGEAMPYAESTSIKAALAGDGLPQDLIEALTQDQLRLYMASRQKRDEAFDRMRNKVNAAQSPTDESEEKTDEAGAPQELDNPAASVDLVALTEEFGEDEAKAIAGYMDSVMNPLRSTNEQLLNALDQMIDTAQQTRLSGMVPGDLGEGWYEKVRTRAVELGNAGTYSEKTGQGRQDALFDAALRLEFPDAPSPAEMKRESKRASQRRNGTPSRSGRVARKSLKLTKEEATDRRLELVMEGKTVQEIARELGD